MANTADVEAVDFEPEDDDLMDEDGGVDVDASPRAPIPKLKSAITGGGFLPKKTKKGRGFREETDVERNNRMSGRFDSLDSDGGPGPERSIEGWIILVTGVHEEAQEDDLQNAFGEYGEIKNLHLNLDRRTGFVKGYALIEYENFEEAEKAIAEMDRGELLTQTITVDWAFSKGPFKRRNARRRILPMTKYGMATERQSSTSDVTSNPESAPTGSSHGGSETSSLLITSHKLNGNNYLQWSQSVMMYICGKGKDEYLTGEIIIPKKDDPIFRSWKAENQMVISWLINSMNNDIGENFLLYGTAKEIWDATREMYSSLENTAELFEIEANLHDLRQGELTVTQYFNNLARLWQQLDMFEVHNWKCFEDTALYRKIMEQKRTFKFLLGLNKYLDEVRGRVMGIKPLPSPREAFSEVRREENRKKVMMGSQSSIPTLEGSALAARGQQPNTTSDNRQRKGRPWCDHCRKSGHLRENCWKIHGKPADWKPSRPANDRESRGNVTATTDNNLPVQESNPFTKKQLEMLQKMFGQTPVNQDNASGFRTGMLAQKGFEFGEDDWQC